MSGYLFYPLLFLFILCSIFMIMLVLIQKGRGGGLASAFGGAGANTAFGSKTGDVLTWATSVVFALFLLLAIGLNWAADARSEAADAAITGRGLPTASDLPLSLPSDGAGVPATPAATPGAGDRSPAAPVEVPAMPGGVSSDTTPATPPTASGSPSTPTPVATPPTPPASETKPLQPAEPAPMQP